MFHVPHDVPDHQHNQQVRILISSFHYLFTLEGGESFTDGLLETPSILRSVNVKSASARNLSPLKIPKSPFFSVLLYSHFSSFCKVLLYCYQCGYCGVQRKVQKHKSKLLKLIDESAHCCQREQSFNFSLLLPTTTSNTKKKPNQSNSCEEDTYRNYGNPVYQTDQRTQINKKYSTSFHFPCFSQYLTDSGPIKNAGQGARSPKAQISKR